MTNKRIGEHFQATFSLSDYRAQTKELEVRQGCSGLSEIALRWQSWHFFRNLSSESTFEFGIRIPKENLIYEWELYRLYFGHLHFDWSVEQCSLAKESIMYIKSCSHQSSKRFENARPSIAFSAWVNSNKDFAQNFWVKRCTFFRTKQLQKLTSPWEKKCNLRTLQFEFEGEMNFLVVRPVLKRGLVLY